MFGPWPCVPSLPSFGQGLQLTIHSRDADSARAPEGPVNSLRDLFAALRACWEPPPPDEAFHGMQMSVRFSFKRTGEAVAAPRVTYTSSEADAEARGIYGAPSMPRSSAARRCRSARKWAARSPAARSRFASLTIATKTRIDRRRRIESNARRATAGHVTPQQCCWRILQ